MPNQLRRSGGFIFTLSTLHGNMQLEVSIPHVLLQFGNTLRTKAKKKEIDLSIYHITL